jgi:hypothetical protein
MFETYRMLGREREAELESEAARLRPLAGRPINRMAVLIVAVIVAVLAFGATISRADVWGRSGAQLTTQQSPLDLVERWVVAHRASSPDVIERWVASHESPVRQARPASSLPIGTGVNSGGFDWSDFGVGAGAMLALVLSLGILRKGALTVRTRHSQTLEA